MECISARIWSVPWDRRGRSGRRTWPLVQGMPAAPSAPANFASPAPDGLPAMKCHRSSEKGPRGARSLGASGVARTSGPTWVGHPAGAALESAPGDARYARSRTRRGLRSARVLPRCDPRGGDTEDHAASLLKPGWSRRRPRGLRVRCAGRRRRTCRCAAYGGGEAHPGDRTGAQREEFIARFLAADKDDELIRKFRDSLLYEWACDEVHKPIYYWVIVAIEKLAAPELSSRSDDLKSKLPVVEALPDRWTRRIVEDCRVFNIRSWERDVARGLPVGTRQHMTRRPARWG